MKSISVLKICLALLFVPAVAIAQEQKQESWLGELDVNVAKLRLEIRLTFDEEGTPSATLISLDQNNAEIKVDSLEIDGKSISMEMKSVGASFKGELNEAHTECVGTFTQAGQEFPLTFKKVENVPDRTHVATWKGAFKVGEQEFDFQLRVFEEDDEEIALLDSFTEAIMGLATEFTQEGDDFQFVVPISAGKYVGKLNEDKTKVEGKWIQAGAEYELNFEAVDLTDTRRKLNRIRPQTPKEPFPYDTTELTFENKRAKISLAGTLTTPKGDGPFPTVILVSGSGPQDRDETILDHKPFAVLADHLTRAGIAVFRYDERGVGESTGTYEGATTEDFAEDVEAIFTALRKHPKVKKNRVGIIGHSEGGMVAPMIAARNRNVAFIVMMAGPGVPGKQILLTQSRAISAAEGVPEAALDLNQEIMSKVLDQVSPGNAGLNVIDGVFDELKDQLGGEQGNLEELSELAKTQFKQFETPWFQFFNVYDPLPALRKVRCPVLSVIGEKDLQVDCEMNQEAIEAALKEGGNKDYRIAKLPGLNHLFQKCESGSPTEYAKIEETLNPEFLDLLTTWLLERVD